MDQNLYLEIVSPVKMVYSEEVDSVTIPGTDGSFQVLKNHAALIATFSLGKIKIKKGQETIIYSTSGGIFEVKNNKAIVLAESIETVEEIDIDRAKLAKTRAEEILAMAEANEDEVRDAKDALQRAINRLKIAEKGK
ncbi:MAG TPA: F0F1 ATP synthase subunit epsilon [Ignavibacteria bacterium]|nr:F0F1 ATP synthase subunit epsilon [Ignavibacteria bacterium]HQY52529.1 F0F1 ATP synthase subunit epsilon [Ignavibacteria bacterium]HRB00956.1 F0F1 ATP synthase subunit epsilon [Ignavibacteria bacterium]